MQNNFTVVVDVGELQHGIGRCPAQRNITAFINSQFFDILGFKNQVGSIGGTDKISAGCSACLECLTVQSEPREGEHFQRA